MAILSREPDHEAAATAAVAQLTSSLDDLIRDAVNDSEIERTTNQMKIATAPLVEWVGTQIPSILEATAPELENVSQAVHATVIAGGTIVSFSPPEAPKIRSLPLIYAGYVSGWLISAATALLLTDLWSGQVLFGQSGLWWSIPILLASSTLIGEIVARVVEHGLGGHYLGAYERITLGLQTVVIAAYGALSMQLWMPAASAIGLPLAVTAWIIASMLIVALLYFIGAIGYFIVVPSQHQRHLILASVGSFLALIAISSFWLLVTNLIVRTVDTRQLVANSVVLVAASGGVAKTVRSSWKYLQTPAPADSTANVQWSSQVTLSDSGNPSSSLRPYSERRQLSRDLFDGAKTWRLAALQRGIMPLLRNRINAISNPGYSTELNVHDAPGLRQMHSADFIVRTRAFKELRRNISAIHSGAVGLAGPRGAGKTTLLNAIASGQLTGGRRPKIVITEAVPVKYDARDFVLHLFGRACDAVISLPGPSIAIAPRTVRVVPIHTWTRLLIFAVGWVVVAVMGARVLQDDVSLEKQMAAIWWPFMIGVAILGLVFIVTELFSKLKQTIRIDTRAPMNTISDLRQAAEQRLTEVRFQQRYSTGWSGKISTPFGSEFSGTRTTELTEMVRSYPEIVHEFRSFLMGVLGVLGDDASGDPQLIVIIDELDKISTSAAAEQFINEIKSIFDLGHNANYLYMVSVSEEALASFEQEALTARDAFSSAFDEILRIDYLRLADTYTLLQSRIIGMAEPFLCMCHCLSGGLPREVIRVARKVVDQARDGQIVGVTTLGTVMSKLMVQDLRDRFHGLEAAVDGIGGCEPYASDLLNAVKIAIAEPVDPARLLEAARMPTLCVGPVGADPSSIALNDLFRVQFATLGYLYYAATMMEIFSDDISENRMRRGRDIEDDGSFNRLGSVRGQIARRPRQAWLTVTTFRRAWQLAIVEPPTGP